eukprot:EG_transcript_2078
MDFIEMPSTPIHPPFEPLLRIEAESSGQGSDHSASVQKPPGWKDLDDLPLPPMNFWIIVRNIGREFVHMLVALIVCFCYSLGGGAILFALDEAYLKGACASSTADVAMLNFNASQLDFISSNCGLPLSCPPDRIDLIAAQFYATTLVTNIGYGNTTSYTAGARWFAFFFSLVGLVLIFSLILKIGDNLIHIIHFTLLLVVDVFFPVRYFPGPGSIMFHQAVHLLGEVNGGSGKVFLWDLRNILNDVDGDEYPPPSWATVCRLAADADADGSGDIDVEELRGLMDEYATVLNERRQKDYYSVLVFVFLCLLLWMVIGAFFYSYACPSIPGWGIALYFVFFTLATIGTGDFYPHETSCQAFWWFHTTLGIGFAAVFVSVFAIHLVNFTRRATRQRLELDTKVSFQIQWGRVGQVAQRFEVLLNVAGAVLVILAYGVLGAGAMYGYEYDTNVAAADANVAAFNAQGFTAPQQAYLAGCYGSLSAVNFGFGGALRYCFETIFTVGYGAYAPATDAGRTFMVVYAFFGVGVFALQLEKIAEAVSLGPALAWEALCRAARLRHRRGRQWQRQKVAMLDQLLEDFPSILQQCYQDEAEKEGGGPPRGVSLELLRAKIVELRPDLDRELLDEVMVDFDDDGDRVIECHVVSIKVAHLYTHEQYCEALWTFFGGWFACVLLYVMSIPIFMHLEGWSLGDAAWFCYLTQTTIGLGDYTPHTTGGNVYWFFFVVISVGLIAVWVPSGLTIHWHLRRTLRGRRLTRRRRAATAPPPAV